jgi:hypothetical protein
MAVGLSGSAAPYAARGARTPTASMRFSAICIVTSSTVCRGF